MANKIPKDIEELILSGSKRIYTLTGKNVGESASQSFAKYISGSEFFRDISKANVASQAINHETEITSILFSTGALIFVSVIAVLLIVLVIFTCKGFSHKMVGWSVIFGGVFTGVMGMLTSPFFAPESDLMKDVVAFLMNEFRNISFMWGVAGVVAGIIVITIGKFLSEDGYYYEEPEDEEEGYIEEIEQGVSAE